MKVVDGIVTSSVTTLTTREVYFLQAVTLGLVKIGVTNNAVKRIRDISMLSPDPIKVIGVALCHNSGKLERELHKKYAAKRVRGEWFRLNDDDIHYLEAIGFNPTRVKRLQVEATMPTLPIGRPNKARGELVRNIRGKT